MNLRHQTALLLFNFLGWATASAQLVVTPGSDPVQLAQSLVGSGVSISNVVLNCPNSGWGYFNGINSNVGLDSGIVLTSGTINNMVGPNSSGGITGDNNAPGDADLQTLVSFQTFDACVLEFDVTVTGDTLKFNYVFGSDEYTEWVNSIFNDVFAFFISGPGISGKKNIALIPGTNNPVAINTVNCLNGSTYYVCNEPSSSACPPSYQCNGPGKGVTVEYDGFTKKLTALAVVQPCETYRLKLAVSDVSDEILDSGVWIQAGSLSSTSTTVQSNAPYVDPGSNNLGIVEGCFSGTFDFSLSTVATDTVVIHFEIGGTATGGVDYNELPDSVVILPGQQSTSLSVSAFSDALTEGFETVILYLYLACSNEPYDSAVMYLFDEFNVVAWPDTTICVGDSITLYSTGAGTFQWLPITGLECPTCASTQAVPQGTTNYVVSVTLGNCTASDTATVVVDIPIPVFAGPDVEICDGQSVQLQASNANSYSWSPSTGLSCTDCPNPVANPTTTTTYTVTGINVCQTTTDEITVTVHPNPIAVAVEDMTVCPGDTFQLFASGGVQYSWSPPDWCLNPASENTLATAGYTTTFTVLVTNQFGCSDDEEVVVTVYDIPEITVSNDTTIYLGNSVDLFANGGVGCWWYPPTYLTDPFSCNPSCLNPQDTIIYYVVVTTPEGCKVRDTVRVNVRWDALVLVPTAFSPNNDSRNDLIRPLIKGVFYLDYFRIYNRWGELLYEMTSYDPAAGWDGTWKGQQQPVGAYVYVVSGRDHSGKVLQRSGSVTLVR
ncbi:MAG: choice-of-anchor L domain-containing protein [Chitinophagales bacterium]|nr:gliding motility-associated C-terminal domain-containing protein [Chitinophagales bacterium]MDW8394283.1 choice-of-anchor L domain-containing protein [Chitinophagales bacterium]